MPFTNNRSRNQITHQIFFDMRIDCINGYVNCVLTILVKDPNKLTGKPVSNWLWFWFIFLPRKDFSNTAWTKYFSNTLTQKWLLTDNDHCFLFVNTVQKLLYSIGKCFVPHLRIDLSKSCSAHGKVQTWLRIWQRHRRWIFDRSFDNIKPEAILIMTWN